VPPDTRDQTLIGQGPEHDPADPVETVDTPAAPCKGTAVPDTHSCAISGNFSLKHTLHLLPHAVWQSLVCDDRLECGALHLKSLHCLSPHVIPHQVVVRPSRVGDERQPDAWRHAAGQWSLTDTGALRWTQALATITYRQSQAQHATTVPRPCCHVSNTVDWRPQPPRTRAVNDQS
jgi:hypothetical protein